VQQFVGDITAALDHHNLLPSSDEELLCLAEALYANVLNLNITGTDHIPA
jgi:hypothetical protein